MKQSKKFSPPMKCVRAAENVLALMAHEQSVRETVVGYQAAILAKHQWHIAKKWVESGDSDEIILDPNLTYLLEDDDAAIYYRECKLAREASGLKVDDPAKCPLLVAEGLLMDARFALLDEVSSLPGLDLGYLHSDNMRVQSREDFIKAVDLSLQLLAPHVADSDKILSRLAQPARG